MQLQRNWLTLKNNRFKIQDSSKITGPCGGICRTFPKLIRNDRHMSVRETGWSWKHSDLDRFCSKISADTGLSQVGDAYLILHSEKSPPPSFSSQSRGLIDFAFAHSLHTHHQHSSLQIHLNPQPLLQQVCRNFHPPASFK